MSFSANTSVDLGPLSWVKTEIEHSLAEARSNLDKLAEDSSDAKALKYVVTHLHQVTGALSMVGLSAAAKFSEEAEALVTLLEDATARARSKEIISHAKQATASLSSYLDSLMAGEPDRPMVLAAPYIALNRARGKTDAAETDLFLPDLTVVVPMPDDTVALPKSDMLTEAIKQRRSLYQAGLLKLLREKDFLGGARDMRNATLAIEALQVTSPTRAFWFTASGFFDAIANNPAESGALGVQLFGKIDQQIKLLIEGVQKVPERLFRELLLAIGKSSTKTERVQKIRALYRLDELLAAAPERDPASDESAKALVRSVRDQVQGIKENWLKFTSGNRAALEAFAQQGEQLAKQSAALPNAAMVELLRVISLVGPHLKKTGLPATEVQSLELASALLFVEASLENFFRLSPEFANQAQGIIGRIKGAMSGSALPALDASTNAMMDDFTKRAQERLLMFQVGQEVQVNLATIESTLDAFFRDPLKTAELASLPPLFTQVQGALMILELDEAAALNQMLRERVLQFASGALKGDGHDAEAVAEGVSALGLYVSALQQGAADPRANLLPALIRFGLAERPREFDRSLLKSPVSDADLEVDKQKVQALYADWKQQPDATTTREHLRDAVKELKQNAEVAGDADTVKSSEVTLKAIDASFDPEKTGLTEAMADIAPEKPVETPTQQVVQLIDAPANEVDQELLDIFLEEATEVIATMNDSLVTARQAPHDRETLTTIRRGFHTLKGSGRMVGLVDLGEVAWACEQTMNKWLKDDKPASEGLLKFIDVAASTFTQWVEVLKAKDTTPIDTTEVMRRAEYLKSDREYVEPPAVSLGTVDAVVAEPVSAPLMEASLEPTRDEPVVELAPSSETDPSATASDVPPIEPPELPALLSAEADGVEPANDASLELIPAPASAPTPTPQATAVSSMNIFAELPSLDLAPQEVVSTSSDESDSDVAEAPEAANDLHVDSAETVPSSAESSTAAELEVRIGPVTLPLPLYEIYMAEAQGHVEALDREMATIEANATQPISYAFMRAAHTLTSSSRTTGFTTVADVAFVLEKWLQEAIEYQPSFDDTRLRVTRQVVDVLGSMVLAVHTREFPEARPDIIEALQALRDALMASARAGEASHLYAPLERSTHVDTALVPTEAAPEASPEITIIDVPGAMLDAVAEKAAETAAETAAEAPIDAPTESPAVAEFTSTEPRPVEEVAIPPLPAALTPEQVFAIDSGESLAALTTALVAPAPAPLPTPAPAAQAPVQAEAFESGKDRRAVKDDIDTDLLPIFLEEAREILPQAGDALRRWRTHAEDHAPVAELARHLHTLKGSARMAGLMRLGELAHAMETRIIDMDRVTTPEVGAFEAVDDRLDRFNNALEALSAGDLAPIIEVPVETALGVDVSTALPSPMAAIAVARAEIVAEGEKLEGRERQALLRVNADLVDRFVNEAGELAIARSRVDLELQAFKKALQDLNDNVSRMKTQLREIEIGAETQIQSRLKEAESLGEQFDPLEFDRFSRMQELTRFMAESLNDVVTLQLSLAKNLDEADAALLQQARLNRDLQQGLMGVRLVPLGNLQDRFYRLVRQTAKELEKKANLEFRGVRVEIDRSVLEKITAPFEHLLRNAVAHGLETPADRVAQGKPEIGEVSIDARQVGNEVILTLVDDGAGLNLARIRSKAIEKGLIESTAEVTDAQLAQFIFAAGFSTAESVTQVSGRGVGMDIVRNEIVSLGGRVDVSFVPGKGTTFTIALPLTLAVTQAVMVTVGENTYAIPSVMIEQVQEYKGKRYEPLLNLTEIEWKGNRYPLRSMEVLLGGRAKVSAQRRAFVVLAKSGQQRAAVQVDDIIGNREIVVKSIGPQLARIPGIAGATVLGSGQVVLIMNPVQLVFREAAAMQVEQTTVVRTSAETEALSVAASGEAPVDMPPAQSLADAIATTSATAAFMSDDVPKPVRSNPLVMVVDDSLTVRKITSRMLTREGFEVATAKDGVDGLQQLQDIEPDIILLDIEMPRMDGFEFARNVRADQKTKHIPIIMITSRTADKHRNHAIELGVNEYMGKPYQEEQLLTLIRQYTRQQAAA
jgi:chemosensory pili system protein ChpA (sensor histidine kinase/response regulator)